MNKLTANLRGVLKGYRIPTERPYGSHECNYGLDGATIEYAPDEERWFLEIPSEAIAPNLNGAEMPLLPVFHIKLAVNYCPFCGCRLEEPVACMLAKMSPERQEEIAAKMQAEIPNVIDEIVVWLGQLEAPDGQQG